MDAPAIVSGMRLWSIHPTQLDRVALVSCWRESLLAQAVLAGETRGYTKHPQLDRFIAQPEPLAAVGSYLAAIADEADNRGYHFDRTKVRAALPHPNAALTVTDAQLTYEWMHLLAKSSARSPEWFEHIHDQQPRAHPLFAVIPGGIEPWERVTAD